MEANIFYQQRQLNNPAQEMLLEELTTTPLSCQPPGYVQEHSCERTVVTSWFYLESKRHFVNLNITHGWLQFLMCHNSLESVLCGCSLRRRNQARVICEGGNPERQDVHFCLWDLKCSDVFSSSVYHYISAAVTPWLSGRCDWTFASSSRSFFFFLKDNSILHVITSCKLVLEVVPALSLAHET